MKDLTQGSIFRHIVAMAMPIAVGMILQSLYYVVDLYFVGAIGERALAGVGAAGNATFLVLALTQILGAGTVALISQAVGRKDQSSATVAFNQSLGLATLSGLTVLVAGYFLAGPYVRSVAADEGIVEAGTQYLYWYMPGLALQFALVVMGSALRATGIVHPTLIVQLLSVVLNAILAPVLIAGWGTHHPMGVAGAGLASTIAMALATLSLWGYFRRLQRFVRVDTALIRPQLSVWGELLKIGVPAGGEYALMFVFSAVVYWVIRDFGPAAQAGFGAGARLSQGLVLPAMAVALAAGPIAGQNFGARQADRVRRTFGVASLSITVLMVPLAAIVYWRASSLIGAFAKDAETILVGAQFMRFICWNFIAQGIIFTCSSVFQGLGNTKPSLISSCIRVLTFAIPTVWISGQPGFHLEQVWYLSIATTFLQAVVSFVLLRLEFRKRLDGPMATATPDLAVSP